MVENPRQAYGALLVVIAAAVSGIVIASGFLAPELVVRGRTFWLFVGAVGVMVLCAIASWVSDLPGILAREFGTNGSDRR